MQRSPGEENFCSGGGSDSAYGVHFLDLESAAEEAVYVQLGEEAVFPEASNKAGLRRLSLGSQRNFCAFSSPSKLSLSRRIREISEKAATEMKSIHCTIIRWVAPSAERLFLVDCRETGLCVQFGEFRTQESALSEAGVRSVQRNQHPPKQRPLSALLLPVLVSIAETGFLQSSPHGWRTKHEAAGEGPSSLQAPQSLQLCLSLSLLRCLAVDAQLMPFLTPLAEVAQARDF